MNTCFTTVSFIIHGFWFLYGINSVLIFVNFNYVYAISSKKGVIHIFQVLPKISVFYCYIILIIVHVDL